MGDGWVCLFWVGVVVFCVIAVIYAMAEEAAWKAPLRDDQEFKPCPKCGGDGKGEWLHFGSIWYNAKASNCSRQLPCSRCNGRGKIKVKRNSP